MELTFQPGLFDAEAVRLDEGFRALTRHDLDEGAWVDHQEGWVSGSDALFEEVLAGQPWVQRSRPMYDRRVLEPRLTAPWSENSGAPLKPAIVERMRQVLSRRYGVHFDSVGFNLYRDGRDSVAWHSDQILPEIVDPIVVLVSLGERRKFLMRPKQGGPSRLFMLGRGDLLVTGGTAQRTWDHAVPKAARAGPRISLAFRHGLDPRATAHKRVEP